MQAAVVLVVCFSECFNSCATTATCSLLLCSSILGSASIRQLRLETKCSAEHRQLQYHCMCNTLKVHAQGAQGIVFFGTLSNYKYVGRNNYIYRTCILAHQLNVAFMANSDIVHAIFQFCLAAWYTTPSNNRVTVANRNDYTCTNVVVQLYIIKAMCSLLPHFMLVKFVYTPLEAGGLLGIDFFFFLFTIA